MLNDVTGSITFSTGSPDPFTSVTCAQGEPALICEKHRVPVADLPILVFNGKCQSSSTVPGSPRVTACLLESPPCSWDCAGRHSKPSGNGTYWCAILADLDCYATSVGSRYRLMLPVVTLTLAKCKTSERQSEKMSWEKKCQWPPSVKPFLFWGSSHCCPSSAPVVNFMNTKAAETD